MKTANRRQTHRSFQNRETRPLVAVLGPSEATGPKADKPRLASIGAMMIVVQKARRTEIAKQPRRSPLYPCHARGSSMTASASLERSAKFTRN
jgi:hypothetical protein